MNQYVNPWTPDRIEFITAQWQAGFSAGQIALMMGGDFNRNKVIGKIHRLKLGGRGQPNQRLPRGPRHIHRVTGPRQRAEHFARTYTPPKEKFPLPVILREAPEPVVEPKSRRLSILTVTKDTCKYTPDTQVPFKFCGRKVQQGSSWCPYHHSVCVQMVSSNEARRRADRDVRAA